MSLAERVNAPPPPRRQGLPCSVGTLLSALPDAERAALQAMLDNAGLFPASRLWVELDEEGLTVGKQTINRHRRGECRCESR